MKTGGCNIFIGESGKYVTTGCHNIGMGKLAGGSAVTATGSHNISFGYYAGCCLTSGSQNILIGKDAGQQHKTGSDNIFMGRFSGCATNSGDYNVALGANTLIGTGNKACNVVAGRFAGCALTSGCSNVFLGYGAGQNTSSGDCNIAIGPSVCLPSATGDGQLAIGCGASRWIAGDSSFNVTVATASTFRSTGAHITGVLTATSFVGDGSALTNLPASGGAGDKFNTGITSSIQATIKGYETDVITFGPDNTKRYVIDSISVANVTSGVGSTVNVIASINPGVTTYSSETKVYLAYNIPVPDNGLVELLKQPMVMNPSDVVKVWASDSSYAGVSDALELYASYQEQESTDFIAGYGSTVSVATTALTTVYTSTSNPTVLQSIKLTNRTDAGDFPVTIQLVNGSTATHLAKNLVIPRYSSVEILDRPKRLETSGTVKVQLAAAAGTIDVIVSGKKIT
jgi:hypothetical protein